MSKLDIRLMDDYYGVRDFYYHLIDAYESSEFKPGWEKDIYPTREFLLDSIRNNELYIGEIDNSIVSCMIVNHQYNEGYNHVKWSINVSDEELYVIHALGVDPFYSGQGIAKQMVNEVIKLARMNNIKTIRLDVLQDNIPALKAYEKMGFRYVDTIKMYYEDTGWTEFKVYEYII